MLARAPVLADAMEKRESRAEASSFVVIEIESWVTYTRYMTSSLDISLSATLSTTKNASFSEPTGLTTTEVVAITETGITTCHGVGCSTKTTLVLSCGAVLPATGD